VKDISENYSKVELIKLYLYYIKETTTRWIYFSRQDHEKVTSLDRLDKLYLNLTLSKLVIWIFVYKNTRSKIYIDFNYKTRCKCIHQFI
jgi:hypothetical protein